MLRIYIWDPIGQANDPAAWGDLALDLIDPLLDTGPPIPHRRHARVLPDIYDQDSEQFRRSVRYGHAGMGFRDVVTADRTIVAYRAFWPRDATSIPLVMPETGTIVSSLEADMASEHGTANHVFSIPASWPIDESRVWHQWEAWRVDPPGYAVLGFNCCSSVSRSIFDNLDFEALPFLARSYLMENPSPNTPTGLLHWLRYLENALR